MSKTVDMTTGSIWRHLVRFSIPLVLGNLLQLMYNTVDAIIVGRCVGEAGLAAVGTANPVINLMILGVSGLCIGASVLMGQFFGGKRYDELKREMATLIIAGLAFSLVMLIVGGLMSRQLLVWMQTPDAILDSAAGYLQIIFLGMPFTCLYNVLAAAMRSVGDAKTPVRFLALSSVLNACLDYVFIALLDMGTAGAALATVIAQSVSALLCVGYVYRRIPLLQIGRRELRVDRGLLGQTLRYGSVTALQQACQPVGKLMIQGVINAQGVALIGAFNAVSKVDDFAFIPEQNISHGLMTFIAQNRGAGKPERIRPGFRSAVLISAAYWVCLCTAVLLFKEPIMRLFVSKQEAGELVALGLQYLTLMSFFYLLPALTNSVQGFFRGMGKMKITFYSTLIQIGLRVIFVFVLVPTMGITGVAWASLIGWICMLSAEGGYYLYYRKKLGI